MAVGEDRFIGYDEDGRAILSCWLTREEWRACFCLWFVGLGTGQYGADEIPEAERHRMYYNVGQGLNWAIRLLAGPGQYRFRGLDVPENGPILRRPEVADEPVEPKNELFLQAIRVGRIPVDLERGIPAVCRWMRENGVALPTDPLMDAHSEVVKALKMVREMRSPDEEHAIRDAMRATLESVGIRMGKPKRREHDKELPDDFFFVN